MALPLELDLSNLAEVTFVAGRRPFASALLHVADAVGAYPAGLPRVWREATRRAVGPQMRHLGLLGYFVPEVLSEHPDQRSVSLRSRLAELREFARDAPPDEGLAEALDDMYGARLPDSIRMTAEQQTPFIRSAVRSVTAASSITAEFWPAATALLDREERRVGGATTLEAKTALISTLVLGSRLEGTVLHTDDPDPPRGHLASTVELYPILAGPRASVVTVTTTDRDALTVAAIGYPLPGLAGLVGGDGHPLPESPLAVLLGDLRAEVLTLIDRPATMGTLADRVYTSPSRLPTRSLGWSGPASCCGSDAGPPSGCTAPASAIAWSH